MPRATKICSHPGCINLQPCPDHRPKPWATKANPRSERKLSGYRQQKRSQYILEKYDTFCHVCGGFGGDQVDHVIPLAEGGPDDESNLRPIHKEPCHREKTRAEKRRAWHAARNEPIKRADSSRFPRSILILVGAPAVGKTWTATQLSSMTGWKYRSIDDCGPRGHHTQRWNEMLHWLATVDGQNVIIECNRIPLELTAQLPLAGWSRIVELTAPRDVRERRLAERPGSWSSISYIPSPDANRQLEAATALAPLSTLLVERTLHG